MTSPFQRKKAPFSCAEVGIRQPERTISTEGVICMLQGAGRRLQVAGQNFNKVL